MHTFYFTIDYAIHVLSHPIQAFIQDFYSYLGQLQLERSFSYMKLIKPAYNTDQNLGRLMRIAIEGPDLSAVNFQILEIKINK